MVAMLVAYVRIVEFSEILSSVEIPDYQVGKKKNKPETS